jgi:hypothetical protein
MILSVYRQADKNSGLLLWKGLIPKIWLKKEEWRWIYRWTGVPNKGAGTFCPLPPQRLSSASLFFSQMDVNFKKLVNLRQPPGNSE